MIVEGTADDPMDPDCKWVTLTEVIDVNQKHRAITPERRKRDCESERDFSINPSRQKRLRLVDEKDPLAVGQVKREIPTEHRNMINRAQAWLEGQNEERLEPTVYEEHRLNNSRLLRIQGDQQDELVFEKLPQIQENLKNPRKASQKNIN